ncbi:LAMI_0F01992g1_1 [Lachancea mirantina]|uniref:Transcription initiation factor TFIID subunit 2 n=1 Tax=Lachancea mirantina TaxID=1230905 RepID=A0A1G4JW93_9SACH|nr:LAMI_0F01992g1_1 [Lachancea mirantina]
MSHFKGSSRMGSGSSPFSADAATRFKVAHQRVSLDIDLSTHSISGSCEIIIIPLSDRLEFVSFDCKNLLIDGVIVEGRRCDNFYHDDPFRTQAELFQSGDLSETVLYRDNSVEQSQFLRSKFSDLADASQHSDSNRSQLTIKIPSSVKITLQDPNSLTFFTPVTPSIRTPAQDAIFSPINIKINYHFRNPFGGVLFDTTREQPSWNAFTSNSELCCSASQWMPCVDALEEKCTWELDFSIPKTVRDIGVTKVVGVQQSKRRRRDTHASDDEEDEEEEDAEEEEEEEDNPMNRDMVVCCSEFTSSKEAPHPTDLSRKVVSFQLFNPVAPHHIGWAVGAFQKYTLPRVSIPEEQEEDPDELRAEGEIPDETEGDDVPVQVYVLPGPGIDDRTVLNTTLVCQEVIDFYAKEFGSYPFTCYSILFLASLPEKSMNFASLTLCNTRVLYPPEVIDSMFASTDILAWALASQWSEINITPAEPNDFWCCLGMSGFMVLNFLKKLMGQNEFKYRIKTQSEAIVDQDWERPPMAETFSDSSKPISSLSKDFDFIKLKAPVVLFILDRRMTKTERSFGMSRVLPKIFLQAMSGDLPNNTLSTAHFQHLCERVNRNKLENFFREWVYGSGVPIFQITQRFNKKRMVVEMGVRQCQAQELGRDKTVGPDGFHASALNHMDHCEKNMTSVFTGSMTIRIHEADGTPYEHIVELKDAFTKLDIQYNTKYKRLKRRRKMNKSAKHEAKDATPFDGSENLAEDDNEEIVFVNCLGDVLTTPKDCKSWNLTDPLSTSEEDEFQQQNEAFEWIRIDADFEWICKIQINQPDYMFASQLQQDRDVEAQIDSIRFFEEVITSANSNSRVYSSILTRTVLDDRYFYGVRVEACRALSRFMMKDYDDKSFKGGAWHLIMIFRHYFCHDSSNIPLNNNFSKFSSYFLQKSIPTFLSQVKTENGTCPHFVKSFLLDILRYNENSENAYNDTFYVVTLITSLVDSCIQDTNDKQFVKELMQELRRFENLDRWIPSYQFLVTKCIIWEYVRLAVEGLCEFPDVPTILRYAMMEEGDWSDKSGRLREGLQDLVLMSFKAVLIDGGIKNQEALKLFFEFFCFHTDPYIRIKTVDVLIDAVNFIAVKGYLEELDDDLEGMKKTFESLPTGDIHDTGTSNIVLDDSTASIRERRDVQLRASIIGLITLLRRKFENYEPLKAILWSVLNSPIVGIYQKKRLMDLIRVLYQLRESFLASLPTPRAKKLVAKITSNGIVKIKREGILKVHLAPKIKLNSKSSSNKVKISLASRRMTPSAENRKDSAVTQSPSKKSKYSKGGIFRLGSMPLRFVRISSTEKKIDISATYFNKNVEILRANARSLRIRIKTQPKTEKP